MCEFIKRLIVSFRFFVLKMGTSDHIDYFYCKNEYRVVLLLLQDRDSYSICECLVDVYFRCGFFAISAIFEDSLYHIRQCNLYLTEEETSRLQLEIFSLDKEIVIELDEIELLKKKSKTINSLDSKISLIKNQGLLS